MLSSYRSLEIKVIYGIANTYLSLAPHFKCALTLVFRNMMCQVYCPQPHFTFDKKQLISFSMYSFHMHPETALPLGLIVPHLTQNTTFEVQRLS